MYRFMDLANYQSALNSRRGAAFGFAKIAKQAGEALKPHLGVLVPKLLRLQYDPAKALQEAMGGIWRALVAEPKKTIQEYWAEIMEVGGGLGAGGRVGAGYRAGFSYLRLFCGGLLSPFPLFFGIWVHSLTWTLHRLLVFLSQKQHDRHDSGPRIFVFRSY